MIEPKLSAAPQFDALAVAREHLLAHGGLEMSALDRALSEAMSRQLDYADLYFQLTRYETWTVEDGIVKEGVHSIDQGIGVRAIAGERTGFAYSDQLDEAALLDAVDAARGIARSNGDGRIKVARSLPYQPLYPGVDPLRSLEDRAKVDLLADLDRRVRPMDPRVTQVVASLASVYEIVLVQASDGTLAADVRPLVRINVSVIMEKDGRREQGYAGGGGRGDFGLSRRRGARDRGRSRAHRGSEHGSRAVAGRQHAGRARLRVARHPAARGHRPRARGRLQPQGHFRVHGPIGERVATEQCTVVDDGTLSGRRGSLNVDDEGTPTQCTTLIENGVLKGYMQDKLNARLMKTPLDRQRPARVVRAHADAAHDEHLHAAGQVRSGRDHRVGRQGHLRAEFRRRPGRHHVRQVRVLGERGLSDRERQEDRRRSRARC